MKIKIAFELDTETIFYNNPNVDPPLRIILGEISRIAVANALQQFGQNENSAKEISQEVCGQHIYNQLIKMYPDIADTRVGKEGIWAIK